MRKGIWFYQKNGTMAKINKWQVWLAHVKYEDSPTVQERPVLIIGNTAYVMAYKMTTTDRGDNEREYQLKDWRGAGLAFQTSVRLQKVLHLEERDLIRQLGELQPIDRLSIELRIIRK